jgi:hypothetical protein
MRAYRATSESPKASSVSETALPPGGVSEMTKGYGIILILVVLVFATPLFAEWSEPIYEFSYIEEDCDTPWSIRDVALVPSVNPGNDTLLYLLAEGMPLGIVRIRSGKICHDSLFPSEILFVDSSAHGLENIEFGENLCYDRSGLFVTPVWYKEGGEFGIVRYEDDEFSYEVVPYPYPIHSIASEYMDITSSCNPDSQDLIFCWAWYGVPPKILVLDLFYEPPFEPITYFWPPELGFEINRLRAKRLTADTSIVICHTSRLDLDSLAVIDSFFYKYTFRGTPLDSVGSFMQVFPGDLRGFTFAYPLIDGSSRTMYVRNQGYHTGVHQVYSFDILNNTRELLFEVTLDSATGGVFFKIDTISNSFDWALLGSDDSLSPNLMFVDSTGLYRIPYETYPIAAEKSGSEHFWFLTDMYYPDNDSVAVFWVHGYPDSSELIIDTTDSIEEEVEKPSEITLSAWPNPFNSSVKMTLDSGSESAERLSTIEIFDVNGRMVYETPVGATRRVARSTGQPPVDPYEYIWQPEPFLGSGVYLVRATAGDGESVTKRIVYLK